ncbi:hypothetical protein BMG00_11205 [Thioclava marina]|uniref:Uncharacterized protein n=1 Tax=Thioclava marina TaxID=1915077 RepID=A0ABX3MJT1_9RHOB|nr:hypothetical protein [Thioclava marina]OOY11662.1 hypothetical protein BMG00_11205 [Thioclava marina]
MQTQRDILNELNDALDAMDETASLLELLSMAANDLGKPMQDAIAAGISLTQDKLNSARKLGYAAAKSMRDQRMEAAE